MAKYFIGVVIIVLLAVGGYYVWDFIQKSEPVETLPVIQEPTTRTYATSTFSITYPIGFIVDDAYAYEQFENKPVQGVKFTIPETIATSTNLSSDTYISVEWLPRAKTCTGDIYLPANVKTYELTEGRVEYSVATSSGAAAGNLYEEQVYAFTESSPCTAVRYFIHSPNIGNYLPAPDGGQAGELGAVREFDRAALIRTFDAIRRSLQFVSANSTSTSATP